MIRKKIGTRLEKIVSNYFSNHYTTSFSVFEDFKATVEGIELDAQTMSHLQRLLQIFFLGQLLNLHTLNSIFVRFGIANGYDKVRYKDIRNKLTNNKLHQIFEYVFEQKLIEILLPLAQKDSSALSRTMVTVVLDDSVFKQWLTMQTAEVSEEDSQFYARFFSGQIGRTAAGYQVVALGVNVGGIYYPLYFQCVPKTPLTAKERLDKIAALAAVLAAKRLEKKVLLEKINLDKANMSTDEDKKAIKILKLNIKVKEEAIRVAKKALSMVKNIKKVVEKKVVAVLLIEKMGKFISNIKKNVKNFPVLAFSCDSGYSDISLCDTCEKHGMYYISVPSKSHYFTINDEKTSLKTWIDTEYIKAEKKHNTAQSALPDKDKTPFVYRQRAFYHAQNKDVTLLVFRLGNSKKVTAIYTPDINIKGKTLRRHWFARTQIEQFFKLLKHYMKIQEPRTTKKHDFEFKLLCFAFVALHLQRLIQYIRRHIPEFKHKGLGTLRILLQGGTDIDDILKTTFCNLKTT